MKILVTGAGGFIGRRLVSRLAACGHDVSSLSQDITRPFTLKENFDAVVHLAAYNITHVGSRDAGLYTRVNVEGTRHVLEAVKTRKFIFLSTAKVYKNEGLDLTEESPLGPQGAYEQSKLEAEEVCRHLLAKEALVVFRSVNVIGWGQAPKAVLPVFFQKAKANQMLDIIKPPQTPIQWVYVEDLIDAVMASIDRDGINGVFNIAHTEIVSLQKLAEQIIAVTGSSSTLSFSGGTTREDSLATVICGKARRDLGWRPKTDLKKVLKLYEQAYSKSGTQA